MRLIRELEGKMPSLGIIRYEDRELGLPRGILGITGDSIAPGEFRNDWCTLSPPSSPPS